MATFAPGHTAVIIRLVYDGPPRSGKTTTLAALAGSLARPLQSPGEAEGRTLFFDWVQYVGGSFDGLPICCQIVSVPGQRALARRRRSLLAAADAVVLVADTTASCMAGTMECLGSLRSLLASRPGPPVGVVVQANKRDQPDALPLAALRDLAGAATTAFVESVATEGVGVREAFVLAVRLALDRVREGLAAGIPLEEAAAVETAEELLAQVKAYEAAVPAAAEGPSGLPLAAAMLRETLTREDLDSLGMPHRRVEAEPPPGSGAAAWRAAAGTAAGGLPVPERPPALPDSGAPSGRVWPPIEGRVLLHEASDLAAAPRRLRDGSWAAEAGTYRIHSLAAHRFDDLEAGKRELLRWARLHAGGVERLSPRRCLVLADAGPGSWRLWQVVAVTESLQRSLGRCLLATDPEAAARALLATAAYLLQAREALGGEPRLPCRLGVLGVAQSKVVYAGLLPPSAWIAPPGEHDDNDAALLRREIEPLLRKVLPVSRLDVARTVDALHAREAPTPEGHRVRETVAALLIGG